jgi:hypothetical protein
MGLRAKTGSSKTIVIAPGHPRLDGERIVEEDDRFSIVTKKTSVDRRRAKRKAQGTGLPATKLSSAKSTNVSKRSANAPAST